MKPSAELTWYVEDYGVTVMRRDRNLHLSIPYPWAGLWALVAHGNYDRQTACELISMLCQVARPEAEESIRATLACWIEMGLLEEE